MSVPLGFSTLERILGALPRCRIGVVGDLFLDQYLDLDSALTEPSLETGLEAYQVVGVRNQPGAAGTILNNLAALGVGRISILSAIGADAGGFVLRQELGLRGIDVTHLFESPARHTPTYCKPLLDGRELNRLDLKNRTPTPPELEARLLAALPKLWAEAQALLVLDQVSEADCGVVTSGMREALADLGAREPRKLLLADSRERLPLFRNCWLKANERETVATAAGMAADAGSAAVQLCRRTGRPVFCTRGAQGILVADPGGSPVLKEVPAFPVAGPIDIVGAGDSVSAGIACAYVAGAGLGEAAAFGNLVASVTIQQLGTTGTATPDQLRRRLAETAIAG